MAKKLYEESNIAAIASEIRRFSEVTGKLKPSEMAKEIQEVHDFGYSTGYSNGIGDGKDEWYAQGYSEGEIVGYNAGYTNGTSEGWKNGEKAEQEKFWETLLENGTRTDYMNAFYGTGWTNEIFNPTHDLKPTNAYMMFRNTSITELYDILDEKGITLDTSNATTVQYIFSGANFSRIGVIDVCKATNVHYLFHSIYIQSVEKLICNASTPFQATSFDNARALTDITIEGEIGVSVNFQWSPLTIESIRSIINALQDKSADTSGTKWTLTLGSSNVAKLTDDDFNLIWDKGWDYA